MTLDYFTLDPGSEWSLVGGVAGSRVRRYASFVGAAVTRILELYRNTRESATASVILIGHGLGGSVAKMAAMSLSNPSSVQIIVTVNTETQYLVLDRDMEAILADLESEWSQRSERTRHLSLVTISDTPRVSGQVADVSVPVPRGSGGTWCREMVSRVNRALVTTVSGVTRHVSLDTRMRNTVLRYNILEGGVGRAPEPEDDLTKTITFDRTGYWADILKRQFSVSKGNVTCDHFTSVR